MKAVIRNGRWSSPDTDEPLDSVDLHQVHHQFNRISAFSKGLCDLTHSKIEILSHILDATPEQERAILNVLSMNKKEVEYLNKLTLQ